MNVRGAAWAWGAARGRDAEGRLRSILAEDGRRIIPAPFLRQLLFLTLAIIPFAIVPSGASASSTVSGSTIVMAVKRASFVVLAADRLSHKTDAAGQNPTPTVSHGKIVLHPRLPIAVATSGMAGLPDGRRPAEHATTLLLALSDPSQLVLRDIAQSLINRLQPLVSIARRDRANRGVLDLTTSKLVIALVRDGRAELGRLEISDDATVYRTSPILAAPKELAAFYSTGRYSGDDFIYGISITAPHVLAAHVRRVIEDGIREEARLNGGKNLRVGGPVDVALIDAHGARLVQP